MNIFTFFSNRKTIGLNAIIIMGTVFFGYAIVAQNYYIFFMLIVIIFTVILLRSDFIPIAAILLIIPYTDWAVQHGFIPMQVMWIPELLSILLFVKAVVNRAKQGTKIRLFGFQVVLSFLLISCASLLLNGISIISYFVFLRVLLRYYFLFLAIINLDLNERSMKLINYILLIVFFSQLPLAVIKLIIYGQGESPLGLNSNSETTIVPIIAIGFLLSFYFIYQKRLVYILGIIGFVGFSIIGQKRGFIVFIPLVFVYLLWVSRNFIRIKLKYIIVGGLLVFISIYFSARLIYTLNPQREIWGEFDIKYLYDYGIDYTTGISNRGLSRGRVSTSIAIFNALSKQGVVGLSFGYGPGSILKSVFESVDRREESYFRFGVEYGYNGLSWLGIQVGYLGAVFYFILFLLLLRRSKSFFLKTIDVYWRSFGLGMALFSFTMIVLCFFYSPFFTADSISAFYFCLAGILVARSERRDKQEIIS